MKRYRVVLTKQARDDLRRKLAYIRDHLKNPQAVQGVYDDYRRTAVALAEVAGTVREPDSDKLRERGLKRINFRAHNYFMLFRIRDDRVEIIDIFHGSEDFENKLR